MYVRHCTRLFTILRFGFVLRNMGWLLALLSASLIDADNIDASSNAGIAVANFPIESKMAVHGPIFLTEDQVIQLLEGQWPSLIDAMREALVAAASGVAVQPPRSFTAVKDRGILLSMPGYVGSNETTGEEVLASKLVTVFEGNPRKDPPLPAIQATILLFDVSSGKLNCVLEGTEITARRTAAASVAATKILYNKRHFDSEEFAGDSLVLGILGAGVQGKNHAIAFHATYPNISKIRVWNHRLPKAERLVAELKTLGIRQAAVASTAKECAEGADILVTATRATAPILRGEWVKAGAHINAIGAGTTHHAELDLPLYKSAKIYLDDEAGGRRELHGLEVLGVPLIAPVGDLVQNPDLTPGEQEVTVFHSIGMAVEDALAAQLVYKRYKLTRSQD